MHTHPNARLIPIGRECLIRQHLDEGRSLAQLAADQGIAESTAPSGWRAFGGGPAALEDRCSVRRSQRQMLDSLQLQQVVEFRHLSDDNQFERPMKLIDTGESSFLSRLAMCPAVFR